MSTLQRSKLKPLQIGPIEIEAPLILAPMAGVTSHAFRLLCKNHGAGLVVTERRGTTIVYSLNVSALEQALASLWDLLGRARTKEGQR